MRESAASILTAHSCSVAGINSRQWKFRFPQNPFLTGRPHTLRYQSVQTLTGLNCVHGEELITLHMMDGTFFVVEQGCLQKNPHYYHQSTAPKLQIKWQKCLPTCHTKLPNLAACRSLNRMYQALFIRVTGATTLALFCSTGTVVPCTSTRYLKTSNNASVLPVAVRPCPRPC